MSCWVKMLLHKFFFMKKKNLTSLSKAYQFSKAQLPWVGWRIFFSFGNNSKCVKSNRAATIYFSQIHPVIKIQSSIGCFIIDKGELGMAPDIVLAG